MPTQAAVSSTMDEPGSLITEENDGVPPVVATVLVGSWVCDSFSLQVDVGVFA